MSSDYVILKNNPKKRSSNRRPFPYILFVHLMPVKANNLSAFNQHVISIKND